MRLDQVILRGTRSTQPLPAAVPAGTLYFVTDQSVTERNTGTAWQTYSASPTGPAPYQDLAEGIPVDPPADVARLYALDVNGYTQVEIADGASKVVRLASDNVLIGKVTEPAGVARGACLYLAGATGANPLVRLARADDLATMPAIGLALDAGVLNAFVRVLLSGTLAKLNTSTFIEGDRLYVSPTTAGAMTTTPPVAPAFAQRIGFVTRSHATAGEILVLTTAVAGPPRLHAAAHAAAGDDPVPVTSLAGYPGGTTTFLRSDGTFAAPPDTDTVGLTQLTGDVTAGPGAGSQPAVIAANAVTYAKLQDVSAAARLLGRGAGAGAGDAQEITLGTNLSLSGTTLNAAGASATPAGAVGIVLDGGGAVLTTGLKGFVQVPFACTITGVTVLSTDPAVLAGSIVVDVWKAPYASYPPTVANTITASAKPTLASATKSQDTTLTGWTTAIAAGDVLGFKVDSVATLTRVTLMLTVQGA